MGQNPREHDPRITVIQQELFDEKKSKLQRYAALVVGKPGLLALAKYELIITAYLGWVRLVGHQSIADRPLLLLGVLLIFTGVQLVTFGLLAELMARTYYESQNKPTYAIREIRQSEPSADPPALAAVR